MSTLESTLWREGPEPADVTNFDGAEAPSSRALLARSVTRAIRFICLFVNLGVSIVTMFYAVIAMPAPAPGVDRLTALPALIVTTTISLLVGFGVFTFVLHRRMRPIEAWLAGRGPAEEATPVIFDLGWWVARVLFVLWSAAAVAVTAATSANYPVGRVMAGVIIGVLLAGAVGSTLSFQLVERAARPLLEAALLADPAGARRRGRMLLRLLASWAFSAGAYFVFALVGPMIVNRPSEMWQLRAIVWLNSGVGIGVGLIVITFAARSLTDRVEALREAQLRVEQGDLATVVRVDDGGEIGMLQAGFNRMVAGLREREELHDLFGRQVGVEVVAEALKRGARLGGELRVGSVLFVDVIGSTSLAHERPPTEVVAVLNAFFEAVVRIAALEGGWVNKFEGDAALCAYGVPNGCADHATRALRSARALRGELLSLGRAYPGFDAAIGVSTGEVVAGNVGAEARFEYTLIGDPVNEAARLTEEAKKRPGRVLASGATMYAADGESVAWTEAGVVHLRGRARPTEAFEPATSVLQLRV